MNKYNSLLYKVAKIYNIYKGAKETDNDWKVRLIYSICGMMAYASLWDELEAEPIFIIHLKRKVRSILASYKAMYPELSGCLTFDSNELEEEITNLFLRTGMIYHRPNRIVTSMRREEKYGGIIFQKGISLDSISSVSGVGFYTKQDGTTNYNKVKEMFGLEQNEIKVLWQNTLAAASWNYSVSFAQNTEYLRLCPPFSRGYWTDKPDTNGIVSILRTGMKGAELYYLYRYSGTKMEVSPLQQWQVESGNYRTLACACLKLYGTLPPIECFIDGALVHIHMDYLLPPRELEFLKLYSWPERCISLPSDFNRKLSIEIFKAIKSILCDEGYEFKEV